jgi:hypothetical protein
MIPHSSVVLAELIGAHNNKKTKPEFKGYWVVLGCIYVSIHS